MASDPEELSVTFFPPLYLQRRLWVLNVLRREAVTSILDAGCGEGELLHVLCQPMPWLSPPETTSQNLHKEEMLTLRPTHVAGLDISSRDLEFAVETTAQTAFSSDIRWEELEAKIWKGGLESVNEEFVGIECIVAMEVIEHLPETILPFFAPILLGVYAPRLLLVTTPSYTFNARFSRPDSTTPRSGYTDPTKRTERIFRHQDHKFEWTREEFREWCDGVAGDWGYEVTIGAVGYAVEEDEWGRDAVLGGASQVAEFMRIEGEEWEEKRKERSAEWREKASTIGEHELLARHLHCADESARKPVSLTEIGEAVKVKMEEYREVFMRMEELWFERSISVLCGGWIELLVDAVEEHEKLSLIKEDEGKRSTWRVELLGGVTLEVSDGPLNEPLDYFPEVSVEWEMASGSIPSERGADADAESGYDGQEDEDSSRGWGQRSHTWSIPEEDERDAKSEDERKSQASPGASSGESQRGDKSS